jgi:hypothetical protein
MPHFTARLAAALLACATLGIAGAGAIAPMVKPVASADIAAGQAAPFVGTWSMSLPTREVTDPSVDLATCALPVRIEAANETHIFYLGPNETEADAAIELVAEDDGTSWEPVAGGPSYFTVWVSPDQFYLYDAVAEGEPDWAAPFIYNRCL